ncbi:unnamed protein product, partial [Polarella glacialis]
AAAVAEPPPPPAHQPRQSTPYSSTGAELGSGVREALHAAKSAAVEPGKYDGFWGRKEQAPTSPSAYTSAGKQLPREEAAAGGPKYNEFWRTGPAAGASAAGGTSGSANKGESAPGTANRGAGATSAAAAAAHFPRYAEFAKRFEGRGGDSGEVTGPPSPLAGRSPQETPPDVGQGGGSATPARPTASTVPPSAYVDEAAPSRRPAPPRRAAAPGLGRRMRLIDFLQAKSNEPIFAAAMGYTYKKEAASSSQYGTPSQQREEAAHPMHRQGPP